jgi:hypothetical protein
VQLTSNGEATPAPIGDFAFRNPKGLELSLARSSGNTESSCENGIYDEGEDATSCSLPSLTLRGPKIEAKHWNVI